MADDKKLDRLDRKLDQVLQKARAARAEAQRAKREYEQPSNEGLILNGYNPNRPLNPRPR